MNFEDFNYNSFNKFILIGKNKANEPYSENITKDDPKSVLSSQNLYHTIDQNHEYQEFKIGDKNK